MKYATIPGLDRPAFRVVLGSMALCPSSRTFRRPARRFPVSGGQPDRLGPSTAAEGASGPSGAGCAVASARGRAAADQGAHHASDGRKRVTAEEIAFDLGQSLERLRTVRRPLPAAPGRPRRAGRRGGGGARPPSAAGARPRLRGQQLDARPDRRGERVRPGAGPAVVRREQPEFEVPRGALGSRCGRTASPSPATPRRSTGTGARGTRCCPGRLRRGASSPAASTRTRRQPGPGARLLQRPELGALRPRRAAGAELGGKATIQIAPARVLCQPELRTFALVGPRTVEELEEAASTPGWRSS